jgi:hypothetical protein
MDLKVVQFQLLFLEEILQDLGRLYIRALAN